MYETGCVNVLAKVDQFKDCQAVSGENKYFEFETLREVRKKSNCTTKSDFLSDAKIAFACSIYTHMHRFLNGQVKLLKDSNILAHVVLDEKQLRKVKY